MEDEYKKQIEELKKQIEEEKNERKKKELEEESRIKKLKSSYYSRINVIKLKNLKVFKEKFDQNFCLEDILKLDKEETLSLILNSFKDEKIVESIFYFLDKFMIDMKNKIEDIKHLNIILVGPTGVGKTTIINQLLKLNLMNDIGKPQTQKTEPHISDEIPFLRLIDSKGIEKDPKAGIDFTYNEITNYIKSQENPENYIHCIWYCWTGTRLEEVEINLLKKLSQQYTLEELPVIIVYTNAIKPDKIEQAKKYIKDLGINNDFVEILALDEKIGFANSSHIIPAYGLDRLVELSIVKAKAAINSALYEGLLKGIRNEVKSIINKLADILKSKLKNKVEEIIPKNGKYLNEKKIKKEIEKIIVELIYYFFFLSSDITVDTENGYKMKLENLNLTYTLSPVTLIKIEDFVVDYFNKFFEVFKNN